MGRENDGVPNGCPGTVLPEFLLQQEKVVVSGCYGFCTACGYDHFLPAQPAYQACVDLMAELASAGRIDWQTPGERADPRLSTTSLFGPSRGKMFGVMVAENANGKMMTVRAFSGGFNGVWQVPGWVGPVYDPVAFHQVHDAEEKKIKELGRRLERESRGSVRYRQLSARRKQLSRQLMKRIHDLYRFRNFAGRCAGLWEIFPPGRGIPTGTGDCCAPKLLHYAVRHRLVPVGLAEFYWGASTLSGSRRHGMFYSACRTKCAPVLGFMLCGLNGKRQDG